MVWSTGRWFIIPVEDRRSMKLDSRLVLALDETDGKKALAIAESVGDVVDAIKINWPLVLSEGPQMITKLSEMSDVICDFKVADIPNTVRLIVENAVSRGASAVIVHAFTGDDSLKAAVEAAGDAEIYAVTEMSHPGGKMFTAKHAEEMAKLGVECGVKGFIAPATRPERIADIRKIIGDAKILSPGVGAQGGKASDAIKAGATYAIVGRAIYGSENPRESALSFAEDIRTVL
jgi:orotidine-5'-phosphate decarboxylase